MGMSFEEILIDYINQFDEKANEGYVREENIRELLYFVRNVGDVMNLNLKDDDFRRVIGTFYTDMINNIMKEE